MRQTGLVSSTYYVYIMTNSSHAVLYIGVTRDIANRCVEHQQKKYPNSFSAKYNVNKLVYFEEFRDVTQAIAREKQLKDRSRRYKIELINTHNPAWLDLYQTKFSV